MVRAQGGSLCSLRLAVRTSPFHGEDTGSIPVGNAFKNPKEAYALQSLSPFRGENRGSIPVGNAFFLLPMSQKKQSQRSLRASEPVTLVSIGSSLQLGS